MADRQAAADRRSGGWRFGVAAPFDRHGLNLAVEQGALLVLLVMMPLFESPKSIALAVFLVAAALRHLWYRGLVRPGAPGGAALGFAAAATISGLAALAAAGWGDVGRIEGTGEALTFAAALLAVLCGGYDAAFRRLALWTALAATVAASAWMGVVHLGFGAWDRSLLSLGNVNTAALYLAMATAVAAALLAEAVQRRRAASGLSSAAALALLVPMLVELGSRNGLLAMLAGVGAVLVVSLRRSWPYALAGMAATLAGLVWLRSPRLVEKFERISMDGLDGLVGARAPIWRLGAAGFLEHPVLGVGWGNFRFIDQRALGFDFAPASEPANADHAHSQYLNLLVEGGAVGFAAFALLIALLVGRLVRGRRAAPARAPAWLAGLGAIAATLAGGLFEVALVAEVGLLIAVLAGLAAGEGPPDHAALQPRFHRPR